MFELSLHFVYFTSNEDMLRIMGRLLRRGKNWSAEVTSDLKVMESLIQQRPDIVFIGPGASTDQINRWDTLCQQVGSTLIAHFGGGSGLLYNEIQQYLDSIEQS